MDAIPTGAWRTRVRWRLRGALTWPLFAALTVLEALVMHARPIAGEAIGPVGGFLLAGFLNIVIVAVCAPLLARAAHRRRESTAPIEIVTDHAAAGLLLATAVALATVGVVHHPSVVQSQREDAAMRFAVYRYVETQAPAYRAGLKRVDIDKPADHLYRACVPSPDPHRVLCLIVQTDQSPPGISVDPAH